MGRYVAVRSIFNHFTPWRTVTFSCIPELLTSCRFSPLPSRYQVLWEIHNGAEPAYLRRVGSRRGWKRRVGSRRGWKRRVGSRRGWKRRAINLRSSWSLAVHIRSAFLCFFWSSAVYYPSLSVCLLLSVCQGWGQRGGGAGTGPPWNLNAPPIRVWMW